jgi:hypothetical protein
VVTIGIDVDIYKLIPCPCNGGQHMGMVFVGLQQDCCGIGRYIRSVGGYPQIQYFTLWCAECFGGVCAPQGVIYLQGISCWSLWSDLTLGSLNACYPLITLGTGGSCGPGWTGWTGWTNRPSRSLNVSHIYPLGDMVMIEGVKIACAGDKVHGPITTGWVSGEIRNGGNSSIDLQPTAAAGSTEHLIPFSRVEGFRPYRSGGGFGSIQVTVVINDRAKGAVICCGGDVVENAQQWDQVSRCITHANGCLLSAGTDLAQVKDISH